MGGETSFDVRESRRQEAASVGILGLAPWRPNGSVKSASEPAY